LITTEYDINEIKDRLTYYVLNVLKDEADPTDDRLKEIIADVITDEAVRFKMDLTQ